MTEIQKRLLSQIGEGMLWMALGASAGQHHSAVLAAAQPYSGVVLITAMLALMAVIGWRGWRVISEPVPAKD